jgi:hypothetical protein
MPNAARPHFEPGRVYRTRDLAPWGANTPRLARRLTREGSLRQLAHGLYFAPIPSRFGPAPPEDGQILRGFLGDDNFVVTGPPRWNALGLGSTALFSATLVYNAKRSGTFAFGKRRFHLRRVLFPTAPPLEWFAIDLLENHAVAGVSLGELGKSLTRALGGGRFDVRRLRTMARGFGTKTTQRIVDDCIQATARH